MTGPLPCDELDRIILGARAAMAIRAENRGLVNQRTAFTRPGQPWQPPPPRWHLDYSGQAPNPSTTMVWTNSYWSADA